MIDDQLIGQRIRTARKVAGYKQAYLADHLGLSISTISDIERGQRSITGPELYSLAELLGQPVDYFLKWSGRRSPSFRYLFREASEQGLSTEIFDEFERLCSDYALLEEITETPPLPKPPDYSGFGFRSLRDADRLAQMERARMGLGDGAILDITQLLDEQGGARVFHVPLGPNTLSGAAARDREGWACILVNASEPDYRRAFSIAHEYGHCLAHLQYASESAGLVAAHIDARNPEHHFSSSNDKERFCNAFAASFLMPATKVTDLYERFVRARGGFTDDMLYLMAKYFGVSPVAVGWRLVSLRKVSKPAWKRYLDTGPTLSFLAKRLGYEGPPQAESKLRLPPRFEYLAWKAFHGDEISLTRLAELLQENPFELRKQVEPATSAIDDGSRAGLHDTA